MTKTPKIVKTEQGYLQIRIDESLTLEDTKLVIENHVGMKDEAIVTVTFLADLSEYKTDDVDFYKNKLEETKSYIDSLKKTIEYYKNEYYKNEYNIEEKLQARKSFWSRIFKLK